MVDLFFADTDFHLSMAERAQAMPFESVQIPVLSIEDLITCKVIFNRHKDWLDIEAVARRGASKLDIAYIEHWLLQFLEPDAEEIEHLRQVLAAASGPSA